MASGIEVTGFEDLENIIQDMTLSDAEEKKIVKNAIQPAKETIQQNTPVGQTHELEESVTDSVKKEDMAIVGTIKMGKFYDFFQEFGTSQQKDNVGFFEKSVNSTTDEVIALMAEGLFSKIK